MAETNLPPSGGDKSPPSGGDKPPPTDGFGRGAFVVRLVYVPHRYIGLLVALGAGIAAAAYIYSGWVDCKDANYHYARV